MNGARHTKKDTLPTQSSGRTLLQHAIQQIDGMLAQLFPVVRQFPLRSHDVAEEALLVDPALVERRRAIEHFEDEASQGPVIDGPVVSPAEHDLRSEVERRSAERVGLVRDDFREAEIHDDGVPVRIQQHVLGF